MQEHIEQVLALGGGAIKAWYEVKRDGAGNEIPESGGIRLGFCMADQFVPTAWDNAQVTDGVFISVRQRTAIIIPGWNGINGTG